MPHAVAWKGIHSPALRSLPREEAFAPLPPLLNLNGPTGDEDGTKVPVLDGMPSHHHPRADLATGYEEPTQSESRSGLKCTGSDL